ncbi:sensor histidine kinase [Desulfuribacillus alkaliarsenatis]|uniref:histidine kinase n=1 Tax=Desulfuribacillus alkaliarsenatis TaxID=766136 RepID=A0A1E5G2D4_9FIRM|nr:sensor histidine kinase [Desulfuribacillus alkaliarsenatis]OEF97063.1 hypothetical protein BHF68_05540 [Desulfuribacillus alkaliarsenatis]
MNKRTKRTLDALTFIIIVIVCLITVLGNYENKMSILALSIIFIAFFSFRTFFLFERQDYNRFKIPSILIELSLVLLILSLDTTNVSQIYLIILIVDAVFSYSLRFGMFFVLIAYVFFSLRNFYHFDFENTSTFLLTTFVNGLGFVFLFFIIFFLKLQIQQKQLLAKTMKELEHKNNKLRETSKELEEVIIIKERNRIAHEIHDTVGHTLTTVLIEMEAGKRLIDVNGELAKEKLSMAQSQVRKGLNDIRTSVRSIKNHDDILDFPGAIRNLIIETEKHTGIKVEHDISLHDEIPPTYKKILLRALQEGLTNGIKHGNSTAFKFRLTRNQESVSFMLKDNGAGTDKINLGFGLQAMKERVNEYKGNFKVSSSKDDGFSIMIELPIEDGAYAKH